MIRRAAGCAAALLAVVPGLTGCATDEREKTTLTVYAASSLTSVFERLGETFEAEHPGVEVSFSFAGSSDLVAQVEQGAPADVLASADEVTMAKLGDLAVDPQPFATNTLAIVVPPGNPGHVTEVDDLDRTGLQLVTCAPHVPCGAAAAAVESAAGLDWKPVSEEPAVADVLGKVRSGEADAGLVYVTDVAAAGDAVESVSIPPAVNAVNSYPVAVLEGAREGDLARAWVDLVTGETGQQVLSDAGFGPP